MSRKCSKQMYLPTQEQIREQCEKIKAGLTEEQLNSRMANYQAIPWLPPLVKSPYGISFDE